MSTISASPVGADLNYAPLRMVNFNWISESFSLFGTKPGVWISATLIAFGLPLLVLLLLDFLLGDPLRFDSPVTPASPNSGQTIFLIGFELIYLLISVFFCGGLYRMAVQQVRGLSVSVRDTFQGGRVFGRMTGFTLLFLLAMLGLEIACFAPPLEAMYFNFRSLSRSFGGPHAGLPNNTAQYLFAGFGWFALGCVIFMIVSLVLMGLLLPGFALVADGERVGASFRRSIRGMKREWLNAALLMLVMGLLVLVSEIPVFLGLLVTVPMFFLLSALAYRDMIGMPGMISPAPPTYDPPQAGVWPPPPAVGQVPPSVGGSPPTGGPPPA